MAQKRIKQATQNAVTNNIRLLYDDGTKGEIVSDKIGTVNTNGLVGLTLKQAKMKLGIKE